MLTSHIFYVVYMVVVNTYAWIQHYALIQVLWAKDILLGTNVHKKGFETVHDMYNTSYIFVVATSRCIYDHPYPS